MITKIYNALCDFDKGGYICLIDPDSQEIERSVKLAEVCEKNGADIILVGGSLMIRDRFKETVKQIKQAVNIPVIIFPGIYDFVSPDADAILLLSMLSSRNPELLVGAQVRVAPQIKLNNIEAIGTAYLNIESGNLTSVQYMSNSLPIPRTKNDIAVAHALAGQYLGMKLIYMDAGSGASNPVSDSMIQAVRQNIEIPVIVGGGIKTPAVAAQKIKAGANFVVTGTVHENKIDEALIKEFAEAVHNG